MKNAIQIQQYIKDKKPLISVHEHAFTYNHVPNNFINLKLNKHTFLGLPMKQWMLVPLDKVLQLIAWFPFSWFENTAQRQQIKNDINFVTTIKKQTSLEIFKESLSFETESINTLLMMNMQNGIGGVMNKSIEEQAQELMDIRDKYPNRVLIFYAIDPTDPNCIKDCWKYLNTYKFDGIKVYPSLGYLPSHPDLMALWVYCEKNKIPVVSHCSDATVRRTDNTYNIRGMLYNDEIYTLCNKIQYISDEGTVANYFNHPLQWMPVLKQYPNLYLDLAHFAGCGWSDYIQGKPSWVDGAITLMKTFPNVYADFSYTFSENVDFIKGLKTLMSSDSEILNKVLWGSDYYLDFLSMPYVQARKQFFDIIGDDLMNQIGRVNPRKFLNI